MTTTTRILKHGKIWAAKNVGSRDCPECGNNSKHLRSYEKATLDGTFHESTFECLTCDCVFKEAQSK
jgi:hypothetical protein